MSEVGSITVTYNGAKPKSIDLCEVSDDAYNVLVAWDSNSDGYLDVDEQKNFIDNAYSGNVCNTDMNIVEWAGAAPEKEAVYNISIENGVVKFTKAASEINNVEKLSGKDTVVPVSPSPWDGAISFLEKGLSVSPNEELPEKVVLDFLGLEEIKDEKGIIHIKVKDGNDANGAIQILNNTTTDRKEKKEKLNKLLRDSGFKNIQFNNQSFKAFFVSAADNKTEFGADQFFSNIAITVTAAKDLSTYYTTYNEIFNQYVEGRNFYVVNSKSAFYNNTIQGIGKYVANKYKDKLTKEQIEKLNMSPPDFDVIYDAVKGNEDDEIWQYVYQTKKHLNLNGDKFQPDEKELIKLWLTAYLAKKVSNSLVGTMKQAEKEMDPYGNAALKKLYKKVEKDPVEAESYTRKLVNMLDKKVFVDPDKQINKKADVADDSLTAKWRRLIGRNG